MISQGPLNVSWPDEPILLVILVAALPGMFALGRQILGGWWSGQREVDARRRAQFAHALSAIVTYEELPFVIRRRRADVAEAERLRISTQARAVQERLAFYSAWFRTESLRVAEAYDELVAETRRAAGREMRRGWEQDAITRDSEMNIGDIDLSTIAPLKVAYLEAVRRHLSWRRFLPTRRG